MNITCCLEHVDLALDIVVDECQTAPFVHNVIHNEDGIKKCEYCQNDAKYVVSSEQ